MRVPIAATAPPQAAAQKALGGGITCLATTTQQEGDAALGGAPLVTCGKSGMTRSCAQGSGKKGSIRASFWAVRLSHPLLCFLTAVLHHMDGQGVEAGTKGA